MLFIPSFLTSDDKQRLPQPSCHTIANSPCHCPVPPGPAPCPRPQEVAWTRREDSAPGTSPGDASSTLPSPRGEDDTHTDPSVSNGPGGKPSVTYLQNFAGDELVTGFTFHPEEPLVVLFAVRSPVPARGRVSARGPGGAPEPRFSEPRPHNSSLSSTGVPAAGGLVQTRADPRNRMVQRPRCGSPSHTETPPDTKCSRAIPPSQTPEPGIILPPPAQVASDVAPFPLSQGGPHAASRPQPPGPRAHSRAARSPEGRGLPSSAHAPFTSAAQWTDHRP